MDMGKKPLTRDGFMKRVVVKEVGLPDGQTVCIRILPASFIVAGADDAANIFEPANLLVHSLCEADGELMFAEGEQGEAMAVDHMALKVILDAILDLNGLRFSQEGEAGAPEKN